MLPILIVALIVVVARRITIVAVTVTVFFAFSIARRLLLVVLGTVLLPAVRTIAVVLFATAFAILVAFLIGEAVFLIGR